MAGYVYFTEEQKQRANQVDLEDFLSRQGEKLLRSGREKRLSSDHSITVRGNRWYDHATEKGGYPIDFVKMFYGQSFPDAVSMLLGGEQKSGTGATKTVSASRSQSGYAPSICISYRNTLPGPKSGKSICKSKDDL